MADAINPSYYKFSNGVELFAITGELNGNGAQAVQHVARSTRCDGVTKGKTPKDLIEDLRKAKRFIDAEIARLEEPKGTEKAVVVPIRKPRQWQYLASVPNAVQVTDKHGDLCGYYDGKWHWKNHSGGWIVISHSRTWPYGPYTEVMNVGD